MKNETPLTSKRKNSGGDQPNNLFAQKINFISNASHEFRTPLGIIRGYAQLTAARLERKVQALKKLADNYPDFLASVDHFDADQDVCKQSSKTSNFSPQTIQLFCVYGGQYFRKILPLKHGLNYSGIFSFVGRHYM